MLKQPRFIKEYLPDGDYKLIPNPSYSHFKDHPKPDKIVRKQLPSIWNKLQYYHTPKQSYDPLNCNCCEYNFEHIDKLTKKIDFEKETLKFKENLKNCSKDQKIQKLKWYAQHKKLDVVLISYDKRRNFHKDYRYQWFKSWKHCFICLTAKVENIHHIVMVKNGGSNDEGNLIGLCIDCHSDIHPWMKVS